MLMVALIENKNYKNLILIVIDCDIKDNMGKKTVPKFIFYSILYLEASHSK